MYSGTYNRWFIGEKCYQNQFVLKVKDKLVCQCRHACRNCSFLVTANRKQECFKKFCTYCNKLQLSGNFCYVAPLKPRKLTDRFMYIFLDTECTGDLEIGDATVEHVPNLIYAQQMCSKYEAVDDLIVDLNSVENVPTFSGRTL